MMKATLTKRRHPIVRAVCALGRRAILPMQRQYLKRRVGRLMLENLDGVPLMVLPQVFNPTVFGSSRFLVRVLQRYAGNDTEGKRALDMGTGSGAGAIFAARLGYRVTAVDVNPEAVRCATINMLMLKLETQMNVRQGDLFEAVPGERFDLVLFNPPFFRGAPKNDLDKAWRATDVLERFAEGLPHALTPDGMALLVFSTIGDLDGALDALRANGMELETVAEMDYANEMLVVIAARCAQIPAPKREVRSNTIIEIEQFVVKSAFR